MKLPASSCVRVVALTLLIGNAGSFSVLPKNTRTSSLGSLHVRNLSKDDIQCSCAVEPVVSGKPSPIALARNPREAIQSGAIFSVDELILQWSRRLDELKEKGIKLAMVSVGRPEVGKTLIQHLELKDAENYLFVDPDNVLYDALALNRGLKETFFSPSTPLAFLTRFSKPNGAKELVEVLSKWNKASYIPPKQEQALLQGGTFVFDGAATVFSHYDESTAAHAIVADVMDVASQFALPRQNLRATK